MSSDTSRHAARLLLVARSRVSRYPIRDAVDALAPSFSVAVRAAFALGRKVLPDVDAAVKAVARALVKVVPGLLAKALEAGGGLAAKGLKLTIAAGFDPDQLRDEQGQWASEGGASASFDVPEDFMLADAQYDVNTNYPLDAMVVASVDLNLLSSEYKNDWRVREMSSAIKSGARFPALTLEQKESGGLSVLDGRTRIAAFREAGITGKVPAVIRLYDKGTEGSLPSGVIVDRKRTTSLRAGKRIRTAAAKKPLVFRFDATAPRVKSWARKHAAELVKGIADITRERLRAIVAKHTAGDIDDAAYADALASAVGDEERAEVIARTESMIAVHQGQREAWNQAVDEGLLLENVKRVWIVTADDRLCPICEPLDGETAALDGRFDGEFDGPPAHPNCRCTEGLQ